MSRNVWIAIPCYSGRVHLATMRSIIEDLLALSGRGDRVTLFEESGNSMIAHGRDLICAKFLAGEGTDLIFIDDDVAWPTGSLLKLVDHPVDIVAGLYPRRADPLAFHVRYITERKNLIADPETMLLEVEGVPAGFLKITRNALTKMVLAYPQSRFADLNAPSGYAHALFDNIHEGDVYFGEDYSFCRRWIKIGGQVWVDPEISLTHIGYKGFTGTFGDWLRNRAPA
jgi:hypothetical protein